MSRTFHKGKNGSSPANHEGHRCGPTGKRRFKSHAAAMVRAQEIMSGQANADSNKHYTAPRLLRAYQCPFCAGFHLSSKPDRLPLPLGEGRVRGTAVSLPLPPGEGQRVRVPSPLPPGEGQRVRGTAVSESRGPTTNP